ncbi:MAG: universal stress protein [Chloroflexota bacterium]
MTKKIMVPLDGSKLAEMALPHAVAMAQANLYGITLVRVVPQPAISNSTAWVFAPATDVWEGWADEVKAEANYLEKVAVGLRAKGVDVNIKMLEDDPASALVGYAERHPDVALIVMSTHGRSGLSRWLFGSVAERVLHTSPVPLLLIRSSEDVELPAAMDVPVYKQIVVPLDGSVLGGQALDQAMVLANTFEATLTLVSAVPETPTYTEVISPPAIPTEWEDETDKITDYLEQTSTRIRAEGFAVKTQLEYGPPAEAILGVADRSHADLVVMATHGRSGLSRFWLGSVAMKVVQASSRPVLLVRARANARRNHSEPTVGEKLPV